jgi:CubicO group peptidase (beta-lactamase class C family)
MSMIMKTTSLLKPFMLAPLLLLLSCSADEPQPLTDATSLEHTIWYIENHVESLKIPNVDVAVVDQNEILYSHSHGNGGGIGAQYYIGSVSKSLTAFGLLRMVDEGKVALEDQVSSFLPHLRFSDHVESVTIETLLNHTSGITKLSGYMNVEKLDESHEIKIKSEPGTVFQYSNLNYVLLGLIIEEVTGKSFAEYMHDEVFIPLDMNNSFADKRTPDLTHYENWFTFPVDGGDMDYHRYYIPAGFIISSSYDMSNYIRCVINDGEFNGQQLLSESSMELMRQTWNGDDFQYAMGWKRGRIDDKIFFQHLGTTRQSQSGIFYIPDDSVGFVVLCNSHRKNKVEEYMKGILLNLNGDEYHGKKQHDFLYVIFPLILLFAVSWFGHKIWKIQAFVHSTTRLRILKGLTIKSLSLIAIWVLFPYYAKITPRAIMSFYPDYSLVVITLLALPILRDLIALIYWVK